MSRISPKKFVASLCAALIIWDSVPWPSFAALPGASSSHAGASGDHFAAVPMRQWTLGHWDQFAIEVNGTWNRIFSEYPAGLSSGALGAILASRMSGKDGYIAGFMLGSIANPAAFQSSIRELRGDGNKYSRLQAAGILESLAKDHGNDTARSAILQAAQAKRADIPGSPEQVFDGTRWKRTAVAPAQADAPAGAGAAIEPAASAGAAEARLLRSLLKRGARAHKAAPPIAAAGALPAPERERMMQFNIYVSNLSLMAVEAMNSGAMPVYLAQVFHDASLMADLSIAVMFATMVGNQLNPLVVNRFKLKSAYIGLLGAAFGAAAAIGVVANLGVMTIPALFGLMVSYRMLQAASLTAETTVMPSVYGKDQSAMERFRGRKQSSNAVASTAVQNISAALVLIRGGATLNLIVAPWLYPVAIALTGLTLKIPAEADRARREGWLKMMSQRGKNALGRVVATLKNFSRQVSEGARTVAGDAGLLMSTIASALLMAFKWLTFLLLPQIIAEFGVHAQGDAMAPIIGLIVGMCSFGGLFAGKIVNWQASRLEEKHGDDIAATNRISRESTMRWLKYSALSFLLIGVLVLPLPVAGSLISPAVIAAAITELLHVAPALATTASKFLVTGILCLGAVLAIKHPKTGLAIALLPVFLSFPPYVTLAALAFLACGVIQTIATLKNDSFFDAYVQHKIPSKAADTRAFVMAFSMLIGMLGLVALKYLFYGKLPFHMPSPIPSFAGVPGVWAFITLFGALAAPLTAAFYWVSHRLDMLTRPKVEKHA